MVYMDDIVQIVLDNVQISGQDMARLSCVSVFFRSTVKNQYPIYCKLYREDTRLGKVLPKTSRSYSKECQVCLVNKAGNFDPFTKKSVCDTCRTRVIMFEKAVEQYGIDEHDMIRYDRYQYWSKAKLVRYFRLDDVKECLFYKLRN